MVSSSENSENRCGMCGKVNPPENAVCDFCGARLRPMTAEEMGLTPESPSEDHPLEEPTPSERPQPAPLDAGDEDSFASLRSQYSEEEDATIIGPSASKDRISRQDLYADMEPDFTFGSSTPEEPEPPAAPPPIEPAQAEDHDHFDNIPDWLREASRPSDTGPLQAPGGQIPDWLFDEAPPTAAPTPLPADEVDIPDWLGESKAPTSESTEGEGLFGIPDWLEDTSRAQSTRPMEPTDSTFDWLTEAGGEQATASGPTAQPADETPDWLSNLAESAEDATTQGQATRPMEPASDAADWLTEHQGDKEEPESEAAPAETGIPDWLMSESSSPASVQQNDEPADKGERKEESAPETPPPAPLVASGIPDWLASEPSTPEAGAADWLRVPGEDVPVAPGPAEVEVPAATEASVPDWLRPPGEEPAALSESSSTTDEKDQDWLRIPGEESDIPEADSASSAEEEDVPAWMSGLGLGAITPSSPDDKSETPEVKTPVSSEPEPLEVGVPDWLAEVGGNGSILPSEPAEDETPATEAEPEVPDWLAGLGDAPAESVPPAMDEPASAPEAEPEVPDWLAGLGGAPAESVPPAMDEPASAPELDVEVPDWLAGLGGAPAESAPPAMDEPVSTLEAEPEVPDWLAGLGDAPAESVPPAMDEPVSAPEAEPETPDWLADLATPSPGTSKPATEEPAGITDMPDWLSDVAAGAPAPTEPQEHELDAAGEGAPDWLSDLDDVLGASAPSFSQSEDLLGFSGEMSIDAQSEDEQIDMEGAELPAWLQAVAPGEEPAPIPRTEIPSDMPPELANLRFEAIAGERNDEPATETVGALKDVTGVIRPELLFDGASLEVGKLVEQLIVTEPQRRRINAIEQLLARETQGIVVAEKRSTVPVVRWIIALVLLAVMAAAVFAANQDISLLTPSAAGVGPTTVHNLIEEMPAGSTVIVAFEYEPETMAELQPLAVAVMEQLSQRGDMRVYSISTRTAGTAMAQNALNIVEANAGSTDGWVNIGYISGGSKGISALVIGGLPGTTSPLLDDYQGDPTGLNAASLTDLDPTLMVVISSRWDDLRAWVEQAGVYADIPIVAATSAATAPIVYPYVQSGQIDGLLISINDAIAYQNLNGAEVYPELSAAWYGQALGGAAASVMILIGTLFYGLRGLRQQQEQE